MLFSKSLSDFELKFFGFLANSYQQCCQNCIVRVLRKFIIIKLVFFHNHYRTLIELGSWPNLFSTFDKTLIYGSKGVSSWKKFAEKVFSLSFSDFGRKLFRNFCGNLLAVLSNCIPRLRWNFIWNFFQETFSKYFGHWVKHFGLLAKKLGQRFQNCILIVQKKVWRKPISSFRSLSEMFRTASENLGELGRTAFLKSKRIDWARIFFWQEYFSPPFRTLSKFFWPVVGVILSGRYLRLLETAFLMFGGLILREDFFARN